MTNHETLARRILSRMTRRPPVAWEDAIARLAPELARQADRKKVRDWSLVLAARRIPHRLADGRRLVVPTPILERAVQEIALYEAENRAGGTPQPHVSAHPAGGVGLTVLLMGGLILFHYFTRTPWPEWGLFPPVWGQLGSAKSDLILSGQWWRAVTALTLHADEAHVLSNAVIGGVFTALACRGFGAGLGWLLVLVSGILGNLANALAHGAGHLSVGFSTAVFGAAGVLAGQRSVGGTDWSLRSILIPVTAGLGLLAMLGSEGERTDLGAHLFGFFSGLCLGGVCGLLALRRGLPPRYVDGVLGAVGFILPLAAWKWAFAVG